MKSLVYTSPSTWQKKSVIDNLSIHCEPCWEMFSFAGLQYQYQLVTAIGSYKVCVYGPTFSHNGHFSLSVNAIKETSVLPWVKNLCLCLFHGPVRIHIGFASATIALDQGFNPVKQSRGSSNNFLFFLGVAVRSKTQVMESSLGLAVYVCIL